MALRGRSCAAIGRRQRRRPLGGILLVYNLVRLEMERIATELDVAPTRISFVAALRQLAAFWLLGSKTLSPGALPAQLAKTQDRIRRFVLPPRRPERVFPRAVKSR
jgi:hypothetical protein